MDSRSAAHVLAQIGTLLDLRGAPRFNSRAYQQASRAVLALGVDDVVADIACTTAANVRLRHRLRAFALQHG